MVCGEHQVSEGQAKATERYSGRGLRVEAIDCFEIEVELLGAHRLEQGLCSSPAITA